MKQTTRIAAVLGAFLAGAAMLVAAMLYVVPGETTKPSSVGGPFRLLDHNGRVVTEANFKGRPFLVFFGFTHCPDICPTALFEMSEVLKRLGPDADKTAALFISVDPERDTPEKLKDYVSSFHPRVFGLTGRRRLHHGPFGHRVSDGQRRPLRRAVQSQAQRGAGCGRPEAATLNLRARC